METLVYTPGEFSAAQNFPNDVTPIKLKIHEFFSDLITSGPPESP